MLDHELSISVLKLRGQLRVQIYDREARKNEKKPKLRPKSQQDDEDHDFSDLQGSYAGDVDC